MKTFYSYILIVILFSALSCSNKNDRQKLDKLYSEYLLKQSKINLIQYRVNRIDTFVTGEVWNHTGTATLERNDRDSIFKFSFFGKRDDLDRENIYVENKHFQIYPKTKTFRVENNYGFHVLGAPGGQMVVEDLFNPDTLRATIKLENIEDESFLIKERKVNEGITITKILIISKNTFLPNQIHETVTDTVLNKKSSTTFYISQILIGDQVTNNELKNLVYLSSFTEEIPKIDKSADALIGKPVPDISLKTFNNESLNLRTSDSKVILLDFWELWCGPCLQSLPKVDDFSKTFKSSDFIAIGITTSTLEDAKKYLMDKGIGFTQAQGKSEITDYFKVNSFPRYVLIDKKGFVRYIYYGYSEDIKNKIKSLI
jgi:thiol-disulfide isomerase/thioredoxin